jgi:16S rRNA (cytidine1402-2'-O)-methyltransferase
MNNADINQLRAESKEAGLFIISTPIGNMSDITLRALRILKTADIIYCEDTRETKKILNYYGIKAETDSYNDHSTQKSRERIISQLQQGKMVALVSDAGTPLISDPGYKLVNEAIQAGIKVFPIPGASSVMAALVKSGFPTDNFMFCGFVDSKKFKKYREIDCTLVFFESAKRLAATLEAMAKTFPNREVCVTRELTKLYEEAVSGDFAKVSAHYAEHPPRGEVVMLLSPPAEEEISEEKILAELKAALGKMKLKDASEVVAEKFNLSKKHVYEIGLKLKN